jgi:hypothetical protein
LFRAESNGRTIEELREMDRSAIEELRALSIAWNRQGRMVMAPTSTQAS